MALRTWSALRSLRRSFHYTRPVRQNEDDRSHDSLQKLSRQSFWKSRYEDQSEIFDWFLDPEEVSEIIMDIMYTYGQHSRLIGETVRILDVGCGTSGLPASVLRQTPHAVEYHCLDFVAEAVAFQRQHCERATKGNGLSRYFGTVGNVTELPYTSSLFGVIVDKGTMDALLKDRTSGKVWSCNMVAECHRVLVPQGHFLQVSDEDPDFRCPLLEKAFRFCDPSAAVKFKVHRSGSGMEYFSYHYTKP